MEPLTCTVPLEYIKKMHDLRNIPFAKTEDGYQFASWVYDLNEEKKESQTEFSDTPNGKKAAELFEKAKTELAGISIKEDEYLAWTIHKKEGSNIRNYHQILQELSINFLMLSVSKTAEEIQEANHATEKQLYGRTRAQSSDETRRILNRNNPFADVTIKSQQFFYKTPENETETLFFDTNNIVEKIDKNDRDMLVMRPGFSVAREHGAVQRPMQKITFSDSMTEPIVNDDNHIYVHID